MRDYQYRTHQWLPGKNWADSTPLGPFLVTPDEVGDPHAPRHLARAQRRADAVGEHAPVHLRHPDDHRRPSRSSSRSRPVTSCSRARRAASATGAIRRCCCATAIASWSRSSASAGSRTRSRQSRALDRPDAPRRLDGLVRQPRRGHRAGSAASGPTDEPLGHHFSVTRALPRILGAAGRERACGRRSSSRAATPSSIPTRCVELAAAGHEVAYHGWCHEHWAGLEPRARRRSCSSAARARWRRSACGRAASGRRAGALTGSLARAAGRAGFTLLLARGAGSGRRAGIVTACRSLAAGRRLPLPAALRAAARARPGAADALPPRRLARDPRRRPARTRSGTDGTVRPVSTRS